MILCRFILKQLAIGFIAFFGALHLGRSEGLPPPPQNYFNDYAGVISEATQRDLNARLAKFDRDSTNQIVVAIFPKMDSTLSLDEYTLQVAKAWRVGQHGKKVSTISSRVASLVILCLFGTRAESLNAANELAAKSAFVTANSVRLHYLDWGGRGETILFLAGFNDSAHVYDHFAPQFTDRFHVLGLTRRGVGESEKPPDGYDSSTRVEDIRQFLDELGVSRVSLIGHSMAGDELTLFASRYPKRVSKMVYLDAAYDRTPKGYLAGLGDPTNKPGIMQRMRMEALGLPGASDIHVDKMPPPQEWAILVATHRAVFAFRPDYTKVQAPALAFYAVTADQHYPSSWLPDPTDAGLKAKAEEWWQVTGRALMRQPVEQFRREIPHGEIIELNDAPHYVFMGKSAKEVAAKTREFLLRGELQLSR